MQMQQRILSFVTRSNWYLFVASSLLGYINLPFKFFMGILLGGLMVTVNFHLLARTLKKALTPPNLSTPHTVIAKYYLRFTISSIIIFLLISKNIVNPMGLILGLSVVVASLFLATMFELTVLIFREAV